ncbi:MAG: AAA family ATPase [Acidobacteriota bacterium]
MMMTRESILEGLKKRFPFLFIPSTAYPDGPSETDLVAGLVRLTTGLALASIRNEGVEEDEVLGAAAQWQTRPSPGLPLGLLDLYLRRCGRQAAGLFGLELRSAELEALFLQDLRNLLARLRRAQTSPDENEDPRGNLLADLGYFYLVNFKSELLTLPAHEGDSQARLVLRRPGDHYLGLYPFLCPAKPEGINLAMGADTEGVLVATLPAAGPQRMSDPQRAQTLAECWLIWGEFESSREVLTSLRRSGHLQTENPSLLAARYLTLAVHSMHRGELERAAFGAEQALRARPDMAQAAYLLVSIYRRLGQAKRAEDILRELSKRLPQQRRPLEILGDLSRQRGDLPEAVRLYERASALDPAAESLADKLKRLRTRVQPAREAGSDDGSPERGLSRIEELLVDLTQEAEAGHFEPLQGRETELSQVIEILSCRQKRHALIAGDAGVGKSALVEELARRMAAGEVPEELSRKRLFMMSIATLLAGAKYRGQFEERILELLRELKEVDHILFVDHLHTLINSGLTRGGGLDASGLLKPALVRGEIQVIGSTTYDDYQNSIEKDPTLARCFQMVILQEPSLPETIEILKATLPRLQDYHGVTFDVGAVERTLEPANRLLHEGRLPDKAIDLLDRAAARTALAFRARKRSDSQVGENEILEALAGMARVPEATLAAERGARLANMETWIGSRVVGQDEAVHTVGRVLRVNEQGLKLHPERPNGVFLFMGPTGVGKTALAQSLSEYLFGDKERLVRIDMSEYMDRINSSRLIGSAPGYVGYNDQNQLTDAIRQHPYSVLLLDEIEKADTHLLQLFLQVFDAGRLTDGRGRTVRFHHTTVIMTSNVGSELFLRDPVGYRSPSARQGVPRSNLMHELRQRFSPEFLNRIDEIVFFNPLEKTDVIRIARLELQAVRQSLEQEGRSLVLEPEALRLLAAEGYSFEFGARNLHRVLRRLVLEPLSRLVLADGWERTRTVRVRVKGSGLEVVAEDSSGEQTVAETVESGGEASALAPALET